MSKLADTSTNPYKTGLLPTEYHKIRTNYSVPFAIILNLLESIKTNPRQKLIVADLGAGTGLLSEELLKHPDVIGAVHVIDCSDMMRKICEAEIHNTFKTEKPTPDCAISEGTASNMPVRSHSLDLIVSGDAAHWFKPADEVIKEFNRVLKPDGHIAFIWRDFNPADDFTQKLHHYFFHCDEGYKDSRGQFVPKDDREPKGVSHQFIAKEEQYSKVSYENRKMCKEDLTTLLQSWASLNEFFFTKPSPEKMAGLTKLFEENMVDGHLNVSWRTSVFFGKVIQPELTHEHPLTNSQIIAKQAGQHRPLSL